MSKIKEFSWEEHLKDPSKTYYRNGEKPKEVELYGDELLFSETNSGLFWAHDIDGKVSRFVYTGDPYDLFLEI